MYFEFTYGVLNFPLGMSGLFCNTKTPAHTNTKANKVPILHKSVTIVKFINKAGIPTTKPVTIEVFEDRSHTPENLLNCNNAPFDLTQNTYHRYHR